MAEDGEFIESFEKSLQSNAKNIISLYSDNKKCESNITKLSAKEVILSVSRQMKAIQIADSVKKEDTNKINVCNKNMIIPVNTLTMNEKTNQMQGNKFDTQYVSDTQLLNVIEHVEALMDVPKDIDKEFDTIFDDQTINVESHVNNPDLIKENMNEINDNFLSNEVLGEIHVCKKIYYDVSPSGISKYKGAIETSSNLSNHFTQTQNITNDIRLDGELTKSPKSLIINAELSPFFKSSVSPLVFDLDIFEKFETLAMRLIQNNHNFETVKRIINSHKVSSEFCEQNHFEPVLCDRDKSKSPILNIKKKTFFNKNDTITKLKNGILTIEDHVLFSSDDDHEFKKSQELPLTCALQTSFYNEQDLDKTIYVGFQTASNKSIQVCSTSYNRAKSILDDSIDEIPLTKLVEAIDKSINEYEKQKNVTENNNDTSVTVHCKNNTCNNIDSQKYQKGADIQKDINSTIIYDKTNAANNKPIQSMLDDKLLKYDQIKSICNEQLIKDDIRQNCDYNNTDSAKFNNESGKDLTEPDIDDNILKEFDTHFVVENISRQNEIKMATIEKNEEKLNKPHNIVKKLEISKVKDNFCQNTNYVGFKTANNKKIKVSAHGLRNVKNIFEDIDLSDIQNNIDINNCKKNFDINLPSTSFMDFQEVNNEEEVTEKDLEDTIEFQDINECEIHATGNRTIAPNFIGKKSEIIEKNISFPNDDIINIDSENIGEDIEMSTKQSCLDTAKHNSTFIGFQTASNKPVSISKEAFAKSKLVFQDINKETVLETIHNIIKTVEEINLIEKADSENITIIPRKKTELNHSIGFTTASNKMITISNEALLRTNHIFQDIDSINFNEKEFYVKRKMDQGFKQSNNKLENAFHESSKIVQNIDIGTSYCTTQYNSMDKFKFEGFKTASSKPVYISKEALLKTKNIFKDIEENSFDTDKEKPSNIKTFVGFKTASNKKVNISEEALKRTRNIFEDAGDVNNTLNAKPINTDFAGFKTASNKTVEVSENALSKSRKILQDIDFYGNIKNTSKDAPFGGFKTADHKPVHISEQAFLKTKNIFKDIDKSNNDAGVAANIKAFSGFQTASNKKVNISEEALAKSRKVFEDIQINKVKNGNCSRNTFKAPIIQSSKDSKNVAIVENFVTNDHILDIQDLINTEVIHNLEETLYTEDFYKEETPKCKRSGSPILSCPKARKRKKFETPKTVKPIKPLSDTDKKICNKTFVFDENYKKCKKITLKKVLEIEKSDRSNSDPFISHFRFDTLLKFEFGGKRNDIDSDIWNTDKIKQVFTESVNKKIVPDGWIDNHLKLIIRKLISYEIIFPKTMKNVCTVKNVLNQLKYRYDRELYNVERPALRKILEKDEVPGKAMVLSVVSIYSDGIIVNSVTNPSQNIELLLTDGWYTIMTCTDRMINNLVCEGKIAMGTKLYIHGAELTNCEQGVSPWEDTSGVRLKIFGNSIRRAKWDTRLGFHGNCAILSHLSCVKPDGGKISRLKVFVTRVYPMLYVEKFEDGSTVTRSERLENMYQMKFENDRQNQLEKLYEEIEKYSEKESQDSECLEMEKGSFESGSQICKMMKRSKDPSEFRASLTESQLRLLQEHATKKRGEIIQDMQRKFHVLVKKRGLNVNRNVVPLLKIRVADVEKGGIYKAMITIWRPNELLLDLIKEGSWLEIYNVVPTGVRYSEIQISAGRQSIFKKSKIKEADTIQTYTRSLIRKSYTIKDLQNPITTDYNEIDTCGFIFLIDPSTKEYDSTKQLYQNVYLSDENKNLLAINFWGGINKFGFANILDTGQIVSCVNLQRRHGNTKVGIPQFRATEFTYFTKTCKIDDIRQMSEELSRKFSNINKGKFIEDCVALKNNISNTKHGNTDFSPYRLNSSDYNTTKHRAFIDSPTRKCADENLNLSGLDFESTFKQTDTQELSPKTLTRKRKVNEKIAKLQMYGEPPPLKSIHIRNKTNLIYNSYKSPLTNSASVKKSEHSVASVENISSPKLNRACVKNINPVKLNFNKDTDEPFAEDFDGSPPLSLG